jgi:hypothetical protein
MRAMSRQHRLEHDAAGLAFPQRPRRPQPVTVAFHRDALIRQRRARDADRVQRQLHAVRLEHGTVLGQLQLVRPTRVIEPRLEVHHEPHGAAYHPQLAHEPVPVGRPPGSTGMKSQTSPTPSGVMNLVINMAVSGK